MGTRPPAGPLADLHDDAAKIARIREELEAAMADRDEHIRAHVDEGHTLQAVAAAARLSRPRVIALLAMPAA